LNDVNRIAYADVRSDGTERKIRLLMSDPKLYISWYLLDYNEVLIQSAVKPTPYNTIYRRRCALKYYRLTSSKMEAYPG
jgi:hypothetical protein